MVDIVFSSLGKMDSQLLTKFRELVYTTSGISLSEKKEALITSRITKRLRILGISSYEEYYNYLLNDQSGTELVFFLDVISTNVTHFFREPSHFDFLKREMETWLSEGQQKFRLWSAASSTGEEPYSMAMTISEILQTHKGRAVDVKILATDISTKVIQHCMRGEYSQQSVAKIPRKMADLYLSKRENGNETTFKMSEKLRKMISFNRLNLAKPPFPIQGPFDMIFCRNVMIYFDFSVRDSLISEVYRLLKPGGFFIVGHSEGLTGHAQRMKLLRPSVYQKV